MDAVISVSKNLEKSGRKIYDNNKHFQKLANIMEHPEFRQFYNEYMQDWDNIKLIITFMKIYEAIEKHSTLNLTPYQKIAILKEAIDNAQIREKICQGISNWINTDNKKLSLIEEKSIVTTTS